ncbi:MAG: hypothetical protein QF805_19000, partial [Pirellulaceae bacterium]|nr:hypothetical protein [Pirellulaceae bacterium]
MISARRISLVAIAAFAWTAAFAPRWSTAADYSNLATDKYLGDVEVLATVADKSVFTEGPAVDRNGDVYFTNVPAEKILKWSPATSKLTVFRHPSHQANGLYFAPDGSLLACEGGAARV